MNCQATKKNGNLCTAHAWNGVHCSTHASQLRKQEMKLAIAEGRAEWVTTAGVGSRWVITKPVDGTPGPERLAKMFPMQVR